MRLVKISVPAGWGAKVLNTAFSAGVASLSVFQLTEHYANGNTEIRDVLDIQTSTPKAKEFIDKLLAEEYYDAERITFNIRQPRSLVSKMGIRERTAPLVEPATDLFEELWQFNHVTYGLVGRNFIAAGLLAHGLIEGKTLFTIGGLLFLPILPMVMAISYGITGRQWKLMTQGFKAFAVSTLMLFLGGVSVAILSQPPIRFGDLGSPASGIAISVAVGIAAALAAVDDAGRRELIGLAAASQIALIPVWLGIIMIFGLPADTHTYEILVRILSFAANLTVLIVTVMAIQYATGVIGQIRHVKC